MAVVAPIPSARPNEDTGRARVLLRNANAMPLRECSASGRMSGDEFQMGCTPTASTTPHATSSAAYRRWAQRTSARPKRQAAVNPKLIRMATPDSMYVRAAVVVEANGSRM